MKNLVDIASGTARVLRWIAVLGGACAFLIVLYTTGDVGGRYLAHNPLPATYEVSMILITYVVFLGIAHVQSRKQHLRMDYLWQRFGVRGKAIVDILSWLCGILLLAAIAWQASRWTIDSWRNMDYMQGNSNIPFFIATIGFAVGSFLLCIQYIIDLVQSLSQLLGVGRIGGAR